MFVVRVSAPQRCSAMSVLRHRLRRGTLPLVLLRKASPLLPAIRDIPFEEPVVRWSPQALRRGAPSAAFVARDSAPSGGSGSPSLPPASTFSRANKGGSRLRARSPVSCLASQEWSRGLPRELTVRGMPSPPTSLARVEQTEICQNRRAGSASSFCRNRAGRALRLRFRAYCPVNWRVRVLRGRLCAGSLRAALADLQGAA